MYIYIGKRLVPVARKKRNTGNEEKGFYRSYKIFA